MGLLGWLRREFTVPVVPGDGAPPIVALDADPSLPEAIILRPRESQTWSGPALLYESLDPAPALGNLFVTSERLVFVRATGKSRSIALSSIVSINGLGDGVILYLANQQPVGFAAGAKRLELATAIGHALDSAPIRRLGRGRKA